MSTMIDQKPPSRSQQRRAAKQDRQKQRQMEKFARYTAVHATAIAIKAWEGFQKSGRGAVLLYADSPTAPPRISYAPLTELIGNASAGLTILLQEYCPRQQAVAWLHLRGQGSTTICTREIAPELAYQDLMDQ